MSLYPVTACSHTCHCFFCLTLRSSSRYFDLQVVEKLLRIVGNWVYMLLTKICYHTLLLVKLSESRQIDRLIARRQADRLSCDCTLHLSIDLLRVAWSWVLTFNSSTGSVEVNNGAAVWEFISPCLAHERAIDPVHVELTRAICIVENVCSYFVKRFYCTLFEQVYLQYSRVLSF